MDVDALDTAVAVVGLLHFGHWPLDSAIGHLFMATFHHYQNRISLMSCLEGCALLFTVLTV